MVIYVICNHQSVEPGRHLPGISRRHAIFRESGNFWSLQDLGSTNGTWVNGESINRPTRLKVGDRIAFGQMRFVFRIHVEASRSMLDRIVELAPYDFEKLVGALLSLISKPSSPAKRQMVALTWLP
jgi:pSer/pThr/pTyr-binding forkhead associated (FHA) protein